MNGTAHAAIGAAAGFITAKAYQSDPLEILLFVGIGSVSALIPDLDIDGKLRSKITFSHKVIQTAAQLIGILMIFYSFFEGKATDKWIGMAIGTGMLLLSTLIKQKHMLIITAAGVLLGGISLKESWLMLLAVYIFIASFVSHRSYTHSLLGVLFFGLIAYQLESSIGINGVFYTCLAGYISHLAADLKILPFNRRGIKLFLPFSSKEI